MSFCCHGADESPGFALSCTRSSQLEMMTFEIVQGAWFFLSMVLRRVAEIHGGNFRFEPKVFQGAWMSCRQSLMSFSNVSNLSSGESKVSTTDQGNCCRSS